MKNQFADDNAIDPRDPYYRPLRNAVLRLALAETPFQIATILADFYAVRQRWGVGKMFYDGYGQAVAAAAKRRLAKFPQQ